MQEADSEPVQEPENPVIGNDSDDSASSNSDTDDVTKPPDAASSVVNSFQFPLSVTNMLTIKQKFIKVLVINMISVLFSLQWSALKG